MIRVNQDQNNLNQNNYNIQYNNGIPNNQSVNNQNFNNSFNQGMQSNMNINQQQNKSKRNIILIIVGVIGFGIVGVIGFIFLITSIIKNVANNSDKLVCNSNVGKITIMYNEKTINGYIADGISYNLDEQKKYAEQIGTDAYVQEFTNWFRTNTGGTCTIENKE